MVKRISALAAVLLCVFMLCSCTASRSQIGAYVRGTLDSVYLNENSDEYLESVGGTAEECETQYQQYIRDEVEYFKMCMNIGEVSDATYQRMVKIFETLYAHCKYEVGEVNAKFRQIPCQRDRLSDRCHIKSEGKRHRRFREVLWRTREKRGVR